MVNPPEEVQRQKGVNLKYVNSSAQVKVPSPKSTTTQSPVNVPIGSYLVNRINIWKTIPKSTFANNIISKGLTIPFIDKYLRLKKNKCDLLQNGIMKIN